MKSIVALPETNAPVASFRPLCNADRKPAQPLKVIE